MQARGHASEIPANTPSQGIKFHGKRHGRGRKRAGSSVSNRQVKQVQDLIRLGTVQDLMSGPPARRCTFHWLLLWALLKAELGFGPSASDVGHIKRVPGELWDDRVGVLHARQLVRGHQRVHVAGGFESVRLRLSSAACRA